jgi:hypothetical protein
MSAMAGPICSETTEFMGERYVDDTSLLTVLLDEYNIKVVLKWAQSNLDK